MLQFNLPKGVVVFELIHNGVPAASSAAALAATRPLGVDAAIVEHLFSFALTAGCGVSSRRSRRSASRLLGCISSPPPARSGVLPSSLVGTAGSSPASGLDTGSGGVWCTGGGRRGVSAATLVERARRVPIIGLPRAAVGMRKITGDGMPPSEKIRSAVLMAVDSGESIPGLLADTSIIRCAGDFAPIAPLPPGEQGVIGTAFF